MIQIDAAPRYLGTSVEASYVDTEDLEYAKTQMAQWHRWASRRRGNAIEPGRVLPRYASKINHSPVDTTCGQCSSTFSVQSHWLDKLRDHSKSPTCPACRKTARAVASKAKLKAIKEKRHEQGFIER